MTGGAALGGLLTVISGFLAGCGHRTSPSDGASRKAIEAAVERYVEASNKGDAATMASLYAEDAVLLPPDHEPIRGRARSASGTSGGKAPTSALKVTTLAVEVDGSLGYLVGRYNLPATEEEPADSGKYVMCLKRQRDGSWKLTADIWNQSGDDEEDDDASPSPSIS